MNKLGAGIWNEIREIALYMSIRHAKKYSAIIPVTLINAWLWLGYDITLLCIVMLWFINDLISIKLLMYH